MSPRRSARVASGASSQPNGTAAPSKRKAADDTSTAGEDTGKPPKKTQKTLEETIDPDGAAKATEAKKSKEDQETKDAEMKDEDENVEEEQVEAQADKVKPGEEDDQQEVEKNGDSADADEVAKEELASHADDEVADSKNEQPSEQNGTKATVTKPKETLDNADAIEQSSQIERKTPSSVLEKGLIYFFTRSRVGINEPSGATDLQRTFFVLRPLPANATLSTGALPDSKNNRLFALPKKVFPKSHADRFMTFVEKSNVTLAELKDSFMTATSYQTATQGDRQTPAVAPIGEGVYAFTHTSNTSHLVYMLTIPSTLGPVQEELGISPQGSFQISTKNPTRKGPANASLDSDPGFPEKVIEEEFHGLAWIPSKPHHLDYESAQFLLIGEGEDIEKALQAEKKDQKDDAKAEPKEVLEQLEDADEVRVDKLASDDSVYQDLHVRKQELDVDGKGIMTTW